MKRNATTNIIIECPFLKGCIFRIGSRKTINACYVWSKQMKIMPMCIWIAIFTMNHQIVLTNSECFCFVFQCHVSDNEVYVNWVLLMSTDIVCVLECISKLLKRKDTILSKNVYHDAACYQNCINHIHNTYPSIKHKPQMMRNIMKKPFRPNAINT